MTLSPRQKEDGSSCEPVMVQSGRASSRSPFYLSETKSLPLPDRLRLSTEIDAQTGCWNWKRALTPSGYGRLNIAKRRRISAHRAAYEAFIGPIPPGLEIDHKCRNRRCINPDHLEAVTHQENMARALGMGLAKAARTHCPSGHEYSTENTRFSKKGARICRECGRAEVRARRAKASTSRGDRTTPAGFQDEQPLTGEE